jgi:hypothetical protein
MSEAEGREERRHRQMGHRLRRERKDGPRPNAQSVSNGTGSEPDPRGTTQSLGDNTSSVSTRVQ